jgi:uncharacterized protein (TIGR00369 family)
MTSPLDMLRALGRATVDGSPQAKALGVDLVRVDRAESVMRLPWREDLVGDPETGVIAGGAVTTLLDHTCGQAVWAALEALQPIATLDLRIDYMRPARPREDLLAHALCYKVTRSIAFVRASAYETDPSDPVAAAQASFMLTGSPRDGSARAATAAAAAGARA